MFIFIFFKMYQELLNSLKKYDEFKYNGKGEERTMAIDAEIIQKFARVINGGLSCSPELKIKSNDAPYVNDKTVVEFIEKLNRLRESYVECHLDKAERDFILFKQTFKDLKEEDPALSAALEEGIKQTNSTIKTLFSPKTAYRGFIAMYKHAFSGDLSPEEKEKTIDEFHEAAILIVDCLLTIVNKQSRSLIIDKNNLSELNTDFFDKEKCITQDRFAKNSHLKKHFNDFKTLSEIISRTNSKSRDVLVPLVKSIFCHLICAIMSFKYPVEFSDMKGKYYFFGIFFSTTKHYSELLKPFGVDIRETVLCM